MPKMPFSLFDFSRIEFWGTKQKTLSAAAGFPINAIAIYTCPPHKMALILSADVYTQKTTGTLLSLYVRRKYGVPATNYQDILISEDSVNNKDFGWPGNKAASSNATMGWHICMLMPGDRLMFAHSETVAETIDDDIHWQMIEYSDPRYEK